MHFSSLKSPTTETNKSRLILGILSLLAICLVGYHLAQSFHISLSSFDVTAVHGDMGLFAELARLQAIGGKLYVDLWDNKPPGMFFFMSLFVNLFGNNSLAIGASLVAMALFFILSVTLLVWQVTRSKAATLVAVFFAMYYAATQQLLETTFLMAAFSAAAMTLAVAARGRWLVLFASGLVFAYGAFTKQPLVFELPALVGFALWRSPATTRARIVTILSLGAGSVIGVGAFFAWAWSNGALESMWFHIMTSGVRYVAAADGGWHFRPEAAGYINWFLPITLRYLTILLVSAAVSLLLQLRYALKQPTLWLTLLWAILGIAGASLARGFRTVYFIQVLPALILFVCLGVPYARRFQPAIQAAAIVTIAGLAMATFSTAREGIGWEVEDLSNEQPVIDLIHSETSPDDCLWYWGNLNFFSYLSERQSCTSAAFDGHVMDVTAHPVEVNRLEHIEELIHRSPALYIEDSPWGHFRALQNYADRYRGDLLLFSEPYEVYAVDRSMWHEADANFGNEIRFIGYDLLPVDGPYCPGDTLTLAMTWQQISRPTRQYQMFVQLLTADETARVAGYDGPPEDGDDRNATNTWVDSGEIRLGERFDMAIDARAAPGTYKLIVGLYDVVSTERLPVVDANGMTVGHYAVLQELDVSGDC